MRVGRLTDLQVRCLIALAEMEPPWTLEGGGALVGAYAQHRQTRDLDIFWYGVLSLGDLSTQWAKLPELATPQPTIEPSPAAAGWS